MENTITPVAKKSSSLAIKWGIIIALVACILATINNMFLISNVMLYFAMTAVIGILSIVLLGVAAAQQKKAQGGYITIKEAFRVIFIAILILSVVTFIYSFIYMHFIDPDLMLHMKEGTLAMMEKGNMSQDKLDEASRNFDEKMAATKTVKAQFLAFLESIIIYSVFGFICAAIVKKNPPLEIQP